MKPPFDPYVSPISLSSQGCHRLPDTRTCTCVLFSLFTQGCQLCFSAPSFHLEMRLEDDFLSVRKGGHLGRL